MGKNNRKNYNSKNTNVVEREFNEMKERIFNEQKKNFNTGKTHYNNDMKAPYHNTEEEVNNPYAHINSNTKLFKDMIGGIVSDANKVEGVTTTVTFATKKEDIGIVYAVITSARENCPNDGLSIVVYYLEDRCISPKKASHVDEYTSNILVINEKNHAVLYNRFDVGSKCIDKSDRYIRVMVTKNTSRVLTLGEEQETQEA